MSRPRPRSDVSVDKSARERSPEFSRSNDKDTQGWPVMRIRRLASIEASHVQPWDEFQNTLGRLNDGRGRARAIGSVGCTFFTAAEMRQMIETTFPKTVRNRAKTIDTLRSVARHYNDFVRVQSKQEVDRKFEEMCREELDASCVLSAGDESWVEEDEEVADILIDMNFDEYEPTLAKWGIGDYGVRRLCRFGRAGLKLGLDLSNNDVLHEQIEETRQYFRHEGFEVSFLDNRLRTPHAIVFDAHHTIGSGFAAPRTMPRYLTLEPPKAFVAETVSS